MAQLVNLAITDEECKVQSHLDVNFAPILKLALVEGEDKYPWLTSIDEYGNTYINTRQAKYVADELQKLEVPMELKPTAEKVSKTLSDLKTHTLVAFFGD